MVDRRGDRSLHAGPERAWCTWRRTITEHRIILVREWDAQLAASGCCGRLGGQDTEFGDVETFAANRLEMEAMGEIYRALRGEFSEQDVEIAVVDPRNMVWLVPALLKDARRKGMGFKETWWQLRRGVSYTSIVVDGRVLFSGHLPRTEAAVEAVRKELFKGLRRGSEN